MYTCEEISIVYSHQCLLSTSFFFSSFYFESLVNSTGYCEMLPPAVFDKTILLGASFFVEEFSATVTFFV